LLLLSLLQHEPETQLPPTPQDFPQDPQLLLSLAVQVLLHISGLVEGHWH